MGQYAGGGREPGGAGAAITSIQHGSITINTASTAGTAAITAVNTSNAFVVYHGTVRTGAGSPNGDDATFKVALTSSTVVTATRVGTNTSEQVIYFTVYEYAPGAIASIQTVSGAITGSGNLTLTSVDTTKSAAFMQGAQHAFSSAASDNWWEWSISWRFTSSTNLAISKTTSGGESVTYTFVVVEFNL